MAQCHLADKTMGKLMFLRSLFKSERNDYCHWLWAL